MHRLRTSRLPLAVGLMALIVGVGSAAARVASPAAEAKGGFTLLVGDDVDLTGANAAFGPAYAKTAGLAVIVARRALKQAGVKDVKIGIQHADSGSNPVQAVTSARKLISAGASCIVGPIASGSTQAITLSAGVPAGVTVITPSSASPALANLPANHLLFRVSPSSAVEGPILAQGIAQALGRGKTLSVIGRNDIFGQAAAEYFDAAWKRIGGKIQGPTLVDSGASSYDSEAQKAVSGNPDGIVVLAMFPQDYGTMGAALLRTGKFNTKTVFFGGGQPSPIPSFIPKAAMEGARGEIPAEPRNSGVAKAFDAMFNAASGTKTRQALDQNNFDATILCILSAIAANSSDGTKIAAEMRRVSGPPGKRYSYLQLASAIRDLRAGKDIDYEGVGGTIDFDANGGVTGGAYNWYQYVNSVITPIKQYIWAHGKIRVVKLK